ncbi:hypothetical protein M8C21_018615, partial [Ambrosia artemisiifolia]
TIRHKACKSSRKPSLAPPFFLALHLSGSKELLGYALVCTSQKGRRNGGCCKNVSRQVDY